MRLKTCLKLVAVLCVSPVTVIGAQSSGAPGAGVARVEGVAIDSLHEDFLRGATVMIEGSEATATTDSAGHFVLDNIPPGVRRIEVLHPLLDSIGVTLLTAPLHLTPGERLRLILSTPSVPTLVNIKCSVADRATGPVVVLGTVEYAESSAPVTSAKVALLWTERRISAKNIMNVPHQRSVDVGPEGRFTICGLPEAVSGKIIAFAGNDSTAAVDVAVGGPVGLIGLELPEPGHTAAGTGLGVLEGRVLDPRGGALAGARVAIEGDSAFTVTGADGRFALRNVRTGTRMVSARRLGFEPALVPAELRATRPTEITLRLGEPIAMLDTVTIRAVRKQQGLEKIGFAHRKAVGNGFFMTPEDIERRGGYEINDLLREAPMLRAETVNGRTVMMGRTPRVNIGAGNTISMSHSCVNYWLDGYEWNGGDVNDYVSPAELAAVEVYSAGFTPMQFRSGADDCETVVIWTKNKIR